MAQPSKVLRGAKLFWSFPLIPIINHTKAKLNCSKPFAKTFLATLFYLTALLEMEHIWKPLHFHSPWPTVCAQARGYEHWTLVLGNAQPGGVEEGSCPHGPAMRALCYEHSRKSHLFMVRWVFLVSVGSSWLAIRERKTERRHSDTQDGSSHHGPPYWFGVPLYYENAEHVYPPFPPLIRFAALPVFLILPKANSLAIPKDTVHIDSQPGQKYQKCHATACFLQSCNKLRRSPEIREQVGLFSRLMFTLHRKTSAEPSLLFLTAGFWRGDRPINERGSWFT